MIPLFAAMMQTAVVPETVPAEVTMGGIAAVVFLALQFAQRMGWLPMPKPPVNPTPTPTPTPQPTPVPTPTPADPLATTLTEVLKLLRELLAKQEAKG